MTYAEQVFLDALGAMKIDSYSDSAALISAALERMRSECAKKASDLWKDRENIIPEYDYAEVYGIICGVEVDAPTDTKPIPTGEE